MTDLIERLEAATEGSSELDELIFQHIGWRQEKLGGVYVWRRPDQTKRLLPGPHRFTRQIDSAMTLVPEGSPWSVGETITGPHAWVYDDFERDTMATGATPALALCIAALKVQERDND